MKFMKSKLTLTAIKVTQELIMKSFKLMIPAESDCESEEEGVVKTIESLLSTRRAGSTTQECPLIIQITLETAKLG